MTLAEVKRKVKLGTILKQTLYGKIVRSIDHADTGNFDVSPEVRNLIRPVSSVKSTQFALYGPTGLRGEFVESWVSWPKASLFQADEQGFNILEQDDRINNGVPYVLLRYEWV